MRFIDGESSYIIKNFVGSLIISVYAEIEHAEKPFMSVSTEKNAQAKRLKCTLQIYSKNIVRCDVAHHGTWADGAVFNNHGDVSFVHKCVPTTKGNKPPPPQHW